MTSAQPIRRTLRWRSAAITVELPARLRRLRRGAGRSNEVVGADRHLEILDDRVELAVEKADPGHYVRKDWGLNEEFVAAPERASVPADPKDVAASVAGRAWYHTIELPNGIVTPGLFDHRPLVAHYGLPADLTGKRVIDVATFDGFWAFELERRGGDVTAIDLERVADLDWPAGMREEFLAAGLDRDPSDGFKIAAAARGSKVDHVRCSIYDLADAELGQFDLVHIADVIQHLRDPIKALQQVRSLVKPGGTAHIADAYDPALPSKSFQYLGGWHYCTWWHPSIDGLAQAVLDAGFASVRLHLRYKLDQTNAQPGTHRAVLIATA